MGTTPGRLDATTVSPCQLLEFFLLLMSLSWHLSLMMPLSLDPICPSQPLNLDTFLVDSSAAGDLSGNFFLTNFFLLHSLPYSFHFANLCTSYSCHFSNLSTSLLFSFTTSLLSLFPTLRISRLFPLPCFLHSPLPYFPILSFSYSFSFPGIFWIKCCVWLGE